MIAKKKPEWAWNYSGSNPHGPFPSMKKATQDAHAYYHDSWGSTSDIDHRLIEVGHAIWAEPKNHLPSAESIVELMENDALDNDFSFADDLIFDNISKRQLKALDVLLRKWAQDLPKARVWVFKRVSTVTLVRP